LFGVALDTNIVVSALVFGGRLSRLRAAWAGEIVILVVCRETSTELLRVLAYPKLRLTREDRDILLAQYPPFCETVILLPALPMLLAMPRSRRCGVHRIVAAVRHGFSGERGCRSGGVARYGPGDIDGEASGDAKWREVTTSRVLFGVVLGVSPNERGRYAWKMSSFGITALACFL
jgi:hypothetical protein